jgi:hypothetical protein
VLVKGSRYRTWAVADKLRGEDFRVLPSADGSARPMVTS